MIGVAYIQLTISNNCETGIGLAYSLRISLKCLVLLKGYMPNYGFLITDSNQKEAKPADFDPNQLEVRVGEVLTCESVCFAEDLLFFQV